MLPVQLRSAKTVRADEERRGPRQGEGGPLRPRPPRTPRPRAGGHRGRDRGYGRIRSVDGNGGPSPRCAHQHRPQNPSAPWAPDLIRPLSEHPPNPESFRRITPVSAYWLGFLMADGTRGKDHTIWLKLRRADRGHLEQFTQFLGCPRRPLHEGEDGRCNRTIGVQLRSASLSE